MGSEFAAARSISVDLSSIYNFLKSNKFLAIDMAGFSSCDMAVVFV